MYKESYGETQQIKSRGMSSVMPFDLQGFIYDPRNDGWNRSGEGQQNLQPCSKAERLPDTTASQLSETIIFSCFVGLKPLNSSELGLIGDQADGAFVAQNHLGH
jgi:hypothetical protein